MKSRTGISVVLLVLAISLSSAPLLATPCQTFKDRLSQLQSILQSDNQHLETLRTQVHEEQNHVPVSSGQPWGKTGEPAKPTKPNPDSTQKLIDFTEQQIKQTEQEIVTAEQQLAQCEANLTVHVVPRPDSSDKLKAAIEAVHVLFNQRPLSEPHEDSFAVEQVGIATAGPAGAVGPEGLAGKDSPPLEFPSYDALSGGGDPQIAVGKEWIVVTAYDRVKFYRYGDTTPEPSGQYLTSNPLSTEDLFAPLLDPGSPNNVDRNLASLGVPVCMCDPEGPRLNKSCPENTAHKRMSSTSACTQQIYDARLAYDEEGKRFYILAHTRPLNEPADLRRSFNFLAVTKGGEDPHNGFDYFWWNEAMDEGCSAQGDIPCSTGLYTPGQAADFPSFAITEPYLIEADNVKHHNATNTAGYQIVNIIPLTYLRNPSTPTVKGTSVWDTSLSGLRPVQHLGKYSSKPTSWYLVRTGTQHSVPGLDMVWFEDAGPQAFELQSAFVPTPLFGSMNLSNTCSLDSPMPGTSNLLKFQNLGTGVGNAVMRDDGHLWAVWQDCHSWKGSNSGTASLLVVEVDAVDAKGGKSEPLRSATIGGRALGEDNDPPVGYGNPGVTVTENGDAVIVYNRSSAKVFPEARYSVWRKGDDKPMRSKVLHRGDCSPNKGDASAIANFDTAGIASDPGVQNVVWMAHYYVHDASGQGCVSSLLKAPTPEPKMAIGKLNLP